MPDCAVLSNNGRSCELRRKGHKTVAIEEKMGIKFSEQNSNTQVPGLYS